MDDHVKDFIDELLDHLDYIGWGDSWEREVSEELRWRAEHYRKTGEI